ncbi:MAG: hypothetical protein EAZ20_02945 [Bacteroidetes bacterium]|nr:MAG: hypothetical protein EAZ20_02945 [Bacteroidota bacterium]
MFLFCSINKIQKIFFIQIKALFSHFLLKNTNILISFKIFLKFFSYFFVKIKKNLHLCTPYKINTFLHKNIHNS